MRNLHIHNRFPKFSGLFSKRALPKWGTFSKEKRLAKLIIVATQYPNFEYAKYAVSVLLESG